MGYSTIIDSLVDNRTINEGSLLRDNKQILRKIEKQLHFFKEAFLVGGVSNNLFFIDWFINNRRMYSGYFGLRLRTFLTDVIYENLNTDNLYKSTGEDTKGVFFINKRYLGVVAVYLNKMINEVVLPNSSRLEKCDIFTGRNCYSDTISNYIKMGWKLPKTIDIDKQFKFRERSGYFITMNNW